MPRSSVGQDARNVLTLAHARAHVHNEYNYFLFGIANFIRFSWQAKWDICRSGVVTAYEKSQRVHIAHNQQTGHRMTDHFLDFYENMDRPSLYMTDTALLSNNEYVLMWDRALYMWQTDFKHSALVHNFARKNDMFLEQIVPERFNANCDFTEKRLEKLQKQSIFEHLLVKKLLLKLRNIGDLDLEMVENNLESKQQLLNDSFSSSQSVLCKTLMELETPITTMPSNLSKDLSTDIYCCGSDTIEDIMSNVKDYYSYI